MAEWSEWMKIGDDGTIPDELLPATQFQYLWKINHSFDFAYSWIDAGAGSITMQFRTDFGPHRLFDTAKFSFYCQKDPLDPTPGAVGEYTYWMQNGTTVREAGTATKPTGGTAGQVVFEASGTTWEYGVTRGFFAGDLIGDAWVGDIDAGSKIKFIKYFPCTQIPKRKQLWMRTIGGAPPVQTVLDPATHNKHEFWIQRSCLLTRRQLSVDGTHDGVRSGCAVSVAGGQVLVTAGTAVIEQKLRAFAGGTITAPTGTYWVLLVWAYGQATIRAYQPTDAIGNAVPLPNGATCLARVDGATVSQVPQQQGTIVALDAHDFTAWIEDDGRLVVNVDGVERRRQYQSRDRGASWRTVS